MQSLASPQHPPVIPCRIPVADRLLHISAPDRSHPGIGLRNPDQDRRVNLRRDRHPLRDRHQRECGTYFDIRPFASGNKEDEENTASSASWFRLVWIRSGEGNCHIDMDAFKIGGPNCILFIKPGQVYMMDRNAIAEGYIISFTGSFLGMDDEKSDSGYSGGLLRFFSRQFCQLQPTTVMDFQETVEKMIKELEHNNLFQAEILKRYFKILLIYLTRQFENDAEMSGRTRDMDLVQRFMGLLEKEFILIKMVSDYASRLLLTPNYLNQIVKKLTGHSAGYHIRQRIVLEAKREAIYSDKSMKEIAYLLGFSDVCHFSKFFKNITGSNFVDFRKNSIR